MNSKKLHRTSDKAFCNQCEKSVELKTFEHAADLLKINFKELKVLTENFQIHHLNDYRGIIKICGDSLLKILYSRPTIKYDADIFKTNPSNTEAVFN